MRRLFIVLAKLLGIVQTANFINTFFLRYLGQSGSNNKLLLIQLPFSLALIGLLLFRTESLAEWLGIPFEDLPGKPIDESMLLLGVRLTGLYFTVIAATFICRDSLQIYFGHFFGDMTRAEQLYQIKLMTGPFCELALAIFVMLKAQSLCKWITGNRDSEDEPEGEPGEEGQDV